MPCAVFDVALSTDSQSVVTKEEYAATGTAIVGLNDVQLLSGGVVSAFSPAGYAAYLNALLNDSYVQLVCTSNGAFLYTNYLVTSVSQGSLTPDLYTPPTISSSSFSLASSTYSINLFNVGSNVAFLAGYTYQGILTMTQTSNTGNSFQDTVLFIPALDQISGPGLNLTTIQLVFPTAHSVSSFYANGDFQADLLITSYGTSTPSDDIAMPNTIKNTVDIDID